MGGVTPLADQATPEVPPDGVTRAPSDPDLEVRGTPGSAGSAGSAGSRWPGDPEAAEREGHALRAQYRLRGRHARERGGLRVPIPFMVTNVDNPDDRMVLHALRRNAAVDLDAAQVAVAAALPPSLAAPALDRLVRAGLVSDGVVGGRQRFGLP